MERKQLGAALLAGLLLFAGGCADQRVVTAPAAEPVKAAVQPPEVSANADFTTWYTRALASATGFSAKKTEKSVSMRAINSDTIEAIRALLQTVKTGGALSPAQVEEQLKTLQMSGDLWFDMAENGRQFRLRIYGEKAGVLYNRGEDRYFTCEDVTPVLRAIALIEEEDTARRTLVTDETDLLKIGTALFESYFRAFEGEDVSEWRRLTAFSVEESTLTAGDADEFCVTCVYSVTPLINQFMSANGENLSDGSWTDCQLEVRVKHVTGNTYRIVEMGTGGVGHGLTPILQTRGG